MLGLATLAAIERGSLVAVGRAVAAVVVTFAGDGVAAGSMPNCWNLSRRRLITDGSEIPSALIAVVGFKSGFAAIILAIWSSCF